MAQTSDPGNETPEHASPGRVGFVGIGNMGWPMASSIARAGFPLTVHDADPDRAARFAVETGAAAAATLRELGRACDVVVTMLPTGGIVREVLLEAEEGGLAAALAPGALLIDMSSSDPLGNARTGAALSARDVAMVDARSPAAWRGRARGRSPS